MTKELKKLEQVRKIARMNAAVRAMVRKVEAKLKPSTKECVT